MTGLKRMGPYAEHSQKTHRLREITGGARNTVSGSAGCGEGGTTALATGTGSSGALAERMRLGEEPAMPAKWPCAAAAGATTVSVTVDEDRVRGEPPNNTLPLFPVQAGLFLTIGTCSNDAHAK